MEEEKKPLPQEEEEKQGYVPRPAWQVWGARIGLAVFIVFVIYQILTIVTGGGA